MYLRLRTLELEGLASEKKNKKNIVLLQVIEGGSLASW